MGNQFDYFNLVVLCSEDSKKTNLFTQKRTIIKKIKKDSYSHSIVAGGFEEMS